MYDFFTHAAILLWSIIGTILGGVALVVLVIVIGHETWAFVSELVTTNPDDEE